VPPGMIEPVNALLYSVEAFAALTEQPEAMRRADVVGVWFEGRIRLIKGQGEHETHAPLITWERWRAMLEKEEAHGP
jgi:hypothetical protein